MSRIARNHIGLAGSTQTRSARNHTATGRDALARFGLARPALFAATAVVALAASGAASAADLIVNEAPMAGYVEAPAKGNWDGVYLGVFGGYAAGTAVNDDDTVVLNGSGYDGDVSGWLLGVQAGANMTLGGGVVAGVVGDVAWSNLELDTDVTGLSADVDWQGSLRGKLGLDAGVFMPYLTAGLAVANTNIDTGAFSDSNTHVGWTAGAGVSIAATETMTIDLEYRYSDFGSADYDLGGSSATPVSLTSNAIMVGLNWKL